jgi:molybdopterin-guanine dinucleotide biosynthesis protein
MKLHRPTIVAVSGFSSNVGKTTLVCELLSHLPGWEAIKLTRGHYRSCGREPETCCVSDLLQDEPVVRTGRESNYAIGKDTGRFWDSGAANVHWVIVSDDQVEQGIAKALSRVKAEGVVIEGNSFLQYVEADVTIMCSRAEGGKIKSSARSTLAKTDLLYLSSLNGNGATARQKFASWRAGLTVDVMLNGLQIITAEDLPALVRCVHAISPRDLVDRLSVLTNNPAP